ncbi:unnamed protein product [Malus baccata var. baccata]
MNQALLKLVFDEEIMDVTLKMGGFKAFSPYGFQGIFYQSFWEHLREDVNKLVRTLMNGMAGPVTLNKTHIVLVPKVHHPESVSQFRPISLCNYSYKVLSKVLANRLKSVLPQLISPSQNAFVAGQKIHGHIGIAYEIFHFLKGWKAKNKYELGIKLDMQKAYDHVESDFLDAIMEMMVDRKLLDSVMMGVSGPIISHMFFTNDTLIFLCADGKNCQHLVDLLAKYCDASGQKMNLQKSNVYFGANTHARVAAELAHVLGIPVVNNPRTYLGVPTICGLSKKQGLAYVKGRIMGKLQGWKQSLLSQVGKEVLIKAVVQAIPAYPMSIFKFPAIVYQELDALVAGFWWGSLGPVRKTHWVFMDVLGLPKDMGGLRFRNFSEFNDALLAKQGYFQLAGGSSSYTGYPTGDVSSRDRLVWKASKTGIVGFNPDHLLEGSTADKGAGSLTTGLIEMAFNRGRVPVNLARLLLELSTAVGSYWEAVRLLGTGKAYRSVRQDQVHRWLAHPSPFTKINVDASWSKVSKMGYVGVVVGNEEGRFVAAARYSLLAPNVTVAEVMALLRGYELGTSLDIRLVVFKSDSLESISCLSGSLDNGSWEAFPTLTRFKLLGEAFQHCRWAWVLRSANLAAHFLASVGFMEMCDCVWVDMPPSSLVHVLNKDGLPCPH